MCQGVNPQTLLKIQAVNTAFGAVGSYTAAQNARRTTNFAAALEEQKAADARVRGARVVRDIQRRSMRRTGAARAALGARGIDTGVGSAADIIEGTRLIGDLDALTARENIEREAFGHEVTAQGFRTRAASINPLGEAATSALGSVGRVAEKWYWLSQSGALQKTPTGPTTPGSP